MSRDGVIAAFELQAQWCAEMNSPFTEGLMRRAADDLRAGTGPVTKLIGDWPGHPLADALMMRFAGALHAAALSGRDAKLAALYPDFNPDWKLDDVWAAAVDFLAREEAWVREFLKSPPQTNETRRAIVLLPAFLALARHGPLHMLEIGASAGLLQMWDTFRYRTSTWAWGAGDGPLIDTTWNGPPPRDLDAAPAVASRAACDRNPLDVRDAEHLLRLRAYLWADQRDRFERFDGAVAAAIEGGAQVERADAVDWLERKLKGDLPAGVTVIYHSVVWQYLPPDVRGAGEAAILAAAERATPERRLAWVRFESNRLFGYDWDNIGDMACDYRLWPGDERHLVARADGHARAVTYLADT